MRNRILPGLVFALSALSASAFAQAGADYALTHSGSSAATTNFGSQLNSTLNQSMNRLSQRIQRTLPQSPQIQTHRGPIFSYVSGAASVPVRTPAHLTTPVTPSDPKGSPFPISIQGGEVPCAGNPVSGKAQAEPGKTAASAYMYCRSNNSSASERNLHQSVITLSSAK